MKAQLAAFLGLALLVVTTLWLFFFWAYSTNGLPMGWDSPYYVWKIDSAVQLGGEKFATREGYYHFVYPVIGSWISVLGAGSFLVEILLPFLLWVAGFLLLFLLVKRHATSPNGPLIGLAAGSTWFAFFRLSSDLHANLLSLVLMLSGTLVFLNLLKTPDSPMFKIELLGLATIVLLSSLIHVETTIFLSVAWTAGLCLWFYSTRIRFQQVFQILLGIALPLVPAVIAYVNQLILATSALNGRFPAVPTMHPTFWLVYLGPVGIIVLPLLVLVCRSSSFRRDVSPLLTMSIAWLVVSFAIGLAQYAFSEATPFSERAIMLTPTPLLASEILPRLNRPKLMTQGKGLGLVFLAILGGTAAYFTGIGSLYYSSFISSAASQTLDSLRTNGLVDFQDSIFIFHESPIDGGGLAEHDNYWVAAFLGSHFAYFGRLDFLMAGLETPFADERSKLISRRMFTDLSVADFSDKTIVYLQEFNTPEPIPGYYQPFLNPLVEGAYTINKTGWETQGRMIIPAYSSLFSSDDGWGSQTQVWSDTGRTLRINSTTAGEPSTATIAFATEKSGVYGITVRMWDAPTQYGSVSVFLDGRESGVLHYNGTLGPVEPRVFSDQLSEGAHFLSVVLHPGTSPKQYAAIDYVSVTNLSL